MVRIWAGQLSLMHKHAFGLGLILLSLPSGDRTTGWTPKNGLVAEPGFAAVAPGNGVIMKPPVSVCHQVSTISQRPLPTWS
jgi:hypothetical protein